jgi:hypothetical protein
MSSYICEDLLGNEKNSLFRFFFFGGFLTHFTTIVSKTTALSNVKKKNNQGSSESANPGFVGYRKSSLLHYNAIISHSMTSTLVKLFPRITLIVETKIVLLEFKKKNFNLTYEICNRSDNSGVFYCKT